jgi:hypothetical protein
VQYVYIEQNKSFESSTTSLQSNTNILTVPDVHVIAPNDTPLNSKKVGNMRLLLDCTNFNHNRSYIT